MGEYCSLVAIEEPVDVDRLRRLYLNACLELYRVEWRRAFLARDDQRMLCWYGGVDAESVRFVLRQQGLGAPVWQAEVTGGEDPAPGTVAERVIVEFDSASTDGLPGAGVAGQDAASSLIAAGYIVCRVFSARTGDRSVLVVQASDPARVVAALRTAGMAPADAWSCIEVDPKPPRLFAHDTPAPTPRRLPAIGLSSPGQAPVLDVAIIGAGMSGICALWHLLRIGLRVQVLEAAGDVGGVWHWNRYPGARIDSESYTYGFSFADDVLRDWQWQELFAGQPEVEGYLQFVVDRLGLRPHIRLNTRVASARFDSSTCGWQVDTTVGERIYARFLVAATGTLSAVQLPDYPGRDRFAGESHHTARWPAAGVPLARRRVGVVGTGASGVQASRPLPTRCRRSPSFSARRPTASRNATVR
jgi:cyclohexanone monooxygenase